MDWKKYINEKVVTDIDSSYKFNPPAEKRVLESLKSELNLKSLPNQLESLYLQSDGIIEKYKHMEISHLIWSIAEVIKINKEMRNDDVYKKIYLPFDELLFFSDAGNGDLFAFVSLQGIFEKQSIFIWNHEDDSRSLYASNLEEFIYPI